MAKPPTDPRTQIDSTLTASTNASTARDPADKGPIAAGNVVAGRYSIIKLLGHGGMGEVYEAEDLSLRQRVALKTIRSERADDTRAVERFKREALLARRVTHRNVCRVFDVGFHDAEMFLTMELLDGETLSARIKRAGPLAIADALPIVGQMVSALAAAHRAGVVHRDFKCSNVMLAGDRVVVTDFGLAHDTTIEAHERSREGFLGSPAYVAPEQVGGREVSFASDIYSLGVVLFEMVTGKLPFVGATPMATAVLRLHEDAPSPATLVPELPAVWQTTIARCLQREPQQRFASVEDVLAALEGERVAPPPSRPRRPLVIAAVGLAALVAAGVGTWSWRKSSTAASAGARDERRVVAVLDLEDRGGKPDDAWRATALAELLSAQLAAGETLRPLSRELVAGRNLGQASTTDAVAQLRRSGAQLAVAGSYRRNGDALDFTVRVVDLGSGRALDEVTESIAPSSLFDGATRMASHLRRALGVPELSPAEARRTRSALPSSPEAAQRYTEGLTAMRHFQPAAAQRAFAAALAVEPDQPMVYRALASAWHELDSEQREREAAQRAFELSTDLPRENRLSIEAAYRAALKDWAGAAQIRLTLATFFPDNLDYGLELADAQRRAGSADDALATLARLRHLPPPDGDDPRLDVAEASTRARKDSAGALAAVKRAIDGATRRGSVGVTAEAHLVGCTVYSASARVENAESECRQASALFNQIGNRAGVARATVALAQIYTTARRADQARVAERDALALYREIGSTIGEMRVRSLMAVAYKRAGEVRTAEKLWKEAIETYRAADEPQLMIKAMDDYASALTDRGAFAEAMPYYREVIETAHAQGLAATEANAMSNFSINLTRRGELEEARRFADSAVALWRKLGQKNDAAFGLDSVEQIALRQGRVDDALKAEQEALAIRESLGWIGGPSRQNLAEIEMERGNLDRAESLARKAADEFHGAHQPGSEIFAVDILMRVLVKQGRVADAAAAAQRQRDLVKQTGDVGYSLVGAQAQVKALQGDVAGALADLRAAIADSDRKGEIDSAIDQRQVLAEVLVRHGSKDEARRALASLRREAAARGYLQSVHDANALERRLH